PIGSTGLSMVDARDIAEVAALHLVKREQSASPLPREVIDLVGPDVLTGSSVAAIWSDVLQRPVKYAGDDVAAYEPMMKAFAPDWMAYDMRLMVARIQREGMVANPGDVERLVSLLGRKLRSYRDFAAETARQWQS